MAVLYPSAAPRLPSAMWKVQPAASAASWVNFAFWTHPGMPAPHSTYQTVLFLANGGEVLGGALSVGLYCSARVGMPVIDPPDALGPDAESLAESFGPPEPQAA